MTVEIVLIPAEKDRYSNQRIEGYSLTPFGLPVTPQRETCGCRGHGG